MKAIPFILLILATAMNKVSGQTQLPSSIKPYAVNWGYSVKSMFQAAGYEVPGPKASFDLKPTIETRSDEPQLDSTVTYHGYDLNMQDSMPLFRNIYTYPQPDMEVITEYYFDIDHWVPLSRTELQTDDLGRLVNALAMIYDDASGIYLPDSRIEFYPYENSMTEADSFFVFGWAPELKDWHRVLAVWNRFDASGHLLESLSSTELFDFPIVFLDRYFYNNDGDLARIESFNIDGNEEYPASRESFWYTDHLLQTSRLEQADGSGAFYDETKTEYTYTAFRKEELVNTYLIDEVTNDWALDHVLGFAYDDEERLIYREEVKATETGGWDRELKTYAYFIGEHPRYEESWSFDIATDQWVLTERKFYYYNALTAYEPVEPDGYETLVMWPNPASSQIQFDMQEDGSVAIYSTTGQLIYQKDIQQGETKLDLTSFMSGTYILKVNSHDKNYAGRFIVQQ